MSDMEEPIDTPMDPTLGEEDGDDVDNTSEDGMAAQDSASKPSALQKAALQKAKAREAQIKAANAAFDEHQDDDLGDIDEAGTEDIDPEQLRLLEAVLFASSEPVSERALAHRLPDGVNVKPLLRELMEFYKGRGVVLVRRGGSWAFRTATDLGQRLNQEVEISKKLSRAAIETLAIIAYHQPVTRAEIEEIRGVSLSKGTLDLLFEEGWIRPRGRRETPGRPMQWGTTDIFLDHFGLESVSQLPGLKELRAMGLLDSRPAIEAYSVHAQMKTSAEVQADMQFRESEIVRSERHSEDDDVAVPPLEKTPLEDAIDAMDPDEAIEEAIEQEPEQEPEPQEELDRSGATKATADKLDAAMEAVAAQVKSAVETLEKEAQKGDDDDDLDGPSREQEDDGTV